MDVLLGSFQKISEWLFFKMLMDRYFQKFKHPFVKNTNGHLSMVEKWETLSKWYWCWITKQKKILRCIGYRCSIPFFLKKENIMHCNNCNDLLQLTLTFWKFMYLRRPIQNPIKHLWWSFYCKNSKLLSIFIKKLHCRCLLRFSSAFLFL